MGGSASNTSSAAPATCPDSMASASATSSISSPRAVLTIRHPALALGEPSPVEKMARFGGRRKMEADVVGRLAHAVEAEELDAERGGDLSEMNGSCATVSMPNARARAATSCPMRPSPTSPRRLAAKLRAGQLLLVPHTALHRRVGGGTDRASDSISASACSATLTLFPPGAFITRMPRALAAARVDVVDAGAGAGNHPKFGRGREQPLINLGGAADDQRVGLAKRRGKDVRLNVRIWRRRSSRSADERSSTAEAGN